MLMFVATFGYIIMDKINEIIFYTLSILLSSSKTYQTYAESLNIQNLLYTSLVYLAICHQPSGRLLICSILADNITKNQIYHTTKSEVRVLFMQARCSNSPFLFNRQNSRILQDITLYRNEAETGQLEVAVVSLVT